jgi:hypothetical protein
MYNMRQKEALHLPADSTIPKQKTQNTAQKSNAEFKPPNRWIVSLTHGCQHYIPSVM